MLPATNKNHSQNQGTARPANEQGGVFMSEQTYHAIMQPQQPMPHPVATVFPMAGMPGMVQSVNPTYMHPAYMPGVAAPYPNLVNPPGYLPGHVVMQPGYQQQVFAGPATMLAGNQGQSLPPPPNKGDDKKGKRKATDVEKVPLLGNLLKNEPTDSESDEEPQPVVKAAKSLTVEKCNEIIANLEKQNPNGFKVATQFVGKIVGSELGKYDAKVVDKFDKFNGRFEHKLAVKASEIEESVTTGFQNSVKFTQGKVGELKDHVDAHFATRDELKDMKIRLHNAEKLLSGFPGGAAASAGAGAYGAAGSSAGAGAYGAAGSSAGAGAYGATGAYAGAGSSAGAGPAAGAGSPQATATWFPPNPKAKVLAQAGGFDIDMAGYFMATGKRVVSQKDLPDLIADMNADPNKYPPVSP
jgi:hypothetical protein